MNKKNYKYVVVHPLDDAPEVKRNVNDVGDLPKHSKWILRFVAGYTVIVVCLALYSITTKIVGAVQ